MSADSAYSLQLDFRPSFHRPSKWLVTRSAEVSDVLVAVSDFHDSKGFELTTEISAGDSELIHNVSNRVLRQVGLWERQVGLDGIGVEGTYQSDELAELSFSFWSPQRNDEPHELVGAVFAAVESLNLGDGWNDYFEQLRWCFAFGAPVRLLEGDPATLRVSCGLSTSMEAELIEIIADAALCSDLVVDMRNFDFMGTMLLPCFAPLVSREAPTRWLASEAAMEYLRMMRVPEALIENPAGANRTLDTKT